MSAVTTTPAQVAADAVALPRALTRRLALPLAFVTATLYHFLQSRGHATPTIMGSSADQLRKAVKSSSIDVWTGKQDKLLRRLDLKARLGFGVPKELQRALGSVVGANFEFELAVSNPNKPVRISPKGQTP